MTKNPTIAIILLAAGSAKRMRKNKLLLSFEGKTLLENVVVNAQNSLANKVIVVLGAYENENLNVLKKYNPETVLNKNWEKGIGSSIKAGLQKAMDILPMLDAVIISVCDQPFLTTEIFDGLINTYNKSGKKIIASAYPQSIGVPVLYDKILFAELLNIPDEYGAKKYVIEKASQKIISTFPFPKGEIDIDTLEDTEKLYLHPEGKGN